MTWIGGNKYTQGGITPEENPKSGFNYYIK